MDLSLPVALVTIAFGVAVGLLSALFGIGGGVVMVPFMVLLLERSQHVAEGTSLLVIIPTAIAGVIAHRRRGYVEFGLAGWLGFGGALGAFAGATLALRIDSELLEKLFALFLAMMGVRLIFEARRTARS